MGGSPILSSLIFLPPIFLLKAMSKKIVGKKIPPPAGLIVSIVPPPGPCGRTPPGGRGNRGRGCPGLGRWRFRKLPFPCAANREGAGRIRRRRRRSGNRPTYPSARAAHRRRVD